MKKLLLAILVMTSATSFANTDGFSKRFKLVRNDEGSLVAIKDQSIVTNFSLRPFIERIKRDIKLHVRSLDDKTYVSEVESLVNEMASDAQFKGEAQNYMVIRDALLGMKGIKVDEIFNDKAVNEVFSKFEFDLKKLLAHLSLNTVSRLDDSKYYYTRAVTYQAVNMALNFAKKRLSNVPVLNTISYVIVRIERLLRERRTYHQNMMLHYFENYTAEELGMTKEEVDLACSSIWESRIPWSGLQESRAAQANWENYGFNKFYALVRSANTRARDLEWNGTPMGEKLNYGFRVATIKVKDQDHKVILNLVDNKHMLSFKPAVAYWFDKPEKVERTRSLLRLAQIGISFIPISDGIKNIANQFINSLYVRQKQTEGALYGYFEAQQMSSEARQIFFQNLNPYDQQ